MEPLVEIVLTTYNGERFIGEQLDSLLQQTHSALRILVFDDGSTDGTEAIVREYIDRHDNIVWHKNERNRGYTMNFLHGLRTTKADYVMLCDQDDIWKPDKVEKTLKTMVEAEKEDKETPILVFTDAEIYDGRTTGNRSFHKTTHLNTKKVDLGSVLMENKCIGCTVMVNRALLGHLEHLPKVIRVHDWWLALIAAGFGRIVYRDEMTLYYRQHDHNEIGGTEYSGYVKKRLGAIGAQREVVRTTYRQGAAFYKLFMAELPEETRRVAEAFAGMERASFFGRRVRMFRYGFKKSGWIRNIGLFFLM
ncbi:MAG: glycosyltransferase family 2 protein [Eubacterium sp.]|nr:glycosyltransferase family 2 protein [Eubacterium sp.]